LKPKAVLTNEELRISINNSGAAWQWRGQNIFFRWPKQFKQLIVLRYVVAYRHGESAVKGTIIDDLGVGKRSTRSVGYRRHDR